MDGILIEVRLAPQEIAATADEVAGKLKRGLESNLAAFKDAGKRIGGAITAGLSDAVEKAREVQQRLDGVLSPDRRIASIQAKEIAHQNRLVEIAARSAEQRSAIEAKSEAQQAAIRAKAAADAERDAQRLANAQAKRFAQPPGSDGIISFVKKYSSTLREAGESLQFAGQAALSITNGIVDFGRAAVQSAVDIDRQVNVLKAFTGSAEAAEKRYAALVALSQKTPGLTSSLAATLDAQLRIANVSVGTIDKILPAIGRLNAVAPLGNPTQFANNLVQLITQNFERADLKELVGNSPLAGELIKQIFNVDSPTNAKAIREAAQKLGITSTEAFFSAFANAAASNPKLASITESLGTQFDKLKDRVAVALRPLGLAIIEALTPLVEKAIPIIEQLSQSFRNLPDGAQQAIIVFGSIAAAIGPVLIAVGALVQGFGAIGNIIGVLANLAAPAAAAGTAVAGVATETVAAGGAIAALTATVPPLALVFGGLAVVIAAVVAANQLFAESTEESARASTAALQASEQRVGLSQKEVDSLRNLQEQSSLNTAEQAKIQEIYQKLTPVQQERVNLYAQEAGGAETLSGKLAGLVQLLDQENQKRREKLQLESVETGARQINQINLTIAALGANEAQTKRLTDEVDKLTKKQAEAENTGARFGQSLIGPGVSAASVYAEKLAAIKPELDKARLASQQSQKDLQALAVLFREAAKASGQATSAYIDQAIAASGLGGDLSGLKLRLLQLATPTTGGTPSRAAILAGQGGTQTDPPKDKPKVTTGGGGDSAESKARQLREAQLRFNKEALEQEVRLTEDANNRQLKSIQHLYDDGLISAQQFYEAKTRLQRANLTAEIGLINQQIKATQDASNAAKGGTPEKIRLEGELLKLRTDLAIKTRELTQIEAENRRESLKAIDENARKFDPLAVFQKSASEQLTKQTDAYLKLLDQVNGKSQEAKQATVEEIAAKALLTDEYVKLTAAQKENILNRAREIDQQNQAKKAAEDLRKDLAQRTHNIELALKTDEFNIQQQINQGILNEAEGKERILAIQRQYRALLIQSFQDQREHEPDPQKIEQFNIEIQKLATLGQELTPTQAFFKGLRSQAETTAEAFERIGTNFKDKFLGVVDSGIDRLTKRFGIFKDLIGDIIKLFARRILTQAITGGFGGGGGVQSAVGGGGGLSGLLGTIFGGLFNTRSSQQGNATVANIANAVTGTNAGNLGAFLTPGFAGGNPAASAIAGSGITGNIGNLIQQAVAGNLSNSISVPPSISSGLPNLPKLPVVGDGIDLITGQPRERAGGQSLLKRLFSASGLLQSIGNIAPLLGLSLGAGLGGQSVLGQILGGAGGTAVGVGLSFATSILGAGGGLGQAALAFLGPAAFIGIPLLVGAFLLGRAKQRRADESTSGDALQDAVDKIHNLTSDVKNDQVRLSVEQAHKLLENDIIAPFVAVINTLKTKSVRESRLAHQVPDLRNLFEKEVIPEIQAQLQRIKSGAFGGRNIVPEFAHSGVVHPSGVIPGVYMGYDNVHVMAHPGEMYLNRQHQSMIAALAGGDIFRKVGVPDAPQFNAAGVQAFANSGTVVQPIVTPSGGGNEPIELTIENVSIGITEGEAGRIVFTGLKTSDGRRAGIKLVKDGRKNGDF